MDGVICFMCNASFDTLNKLFKHFKFEHGILGRYGTFRCAQGQCCRTFTDKYVLSKHIVRDHELGISLESSEVSICLREDGVQMEDDSITQLTPDCESMSVDNDASLPSDDEFLNDISVCALEFISQCKKSSTSLSAVDKMVFSCNIFIQSIVDNLKARCEQFIKKRNMCAADDDVAVLFDHFEQMKHPFDEVSSLFKQSEYLKKSNCLIEPIEYVIGTEQVYKTDKVTKNILPELQEVTGQYVPISEMLKAYLKAGKHAELMRHSPLADCDVLKTFFDGKRWKNIGQDNTIALRFYGDDFEPGNPLGSRKTVHKVGCIYYQCEALPAAELSKTESMLLALCYRTKDVKAFGWRRVLEPLVSDLLMLEKTGLTMSVDNTTVTFSVVISCVTGDNLFLNSILGFVESFTANFPCRHCILHRSEFQSTFTENYASIRDCNVYDENVRVDLVSETGVKEASPLNSLSRFHAANNFVQDLMHDVLEGVCLYDMSIVCKALINDGHLSLQTLNSRIQSFNYCYTDVKNRPPVISKLGTENGSQLCMEAAEAWCFTRVFSLAVGHLVPEDNKVWIFYLTLRQIMDIVFAPQVEVGELNLLQVLIHEYLELHVTLFPEETLKNKHHHLIHYPRLMSEMGPLIRLWAMRFESKHQRAKKLMHVTGNFKNVPKTIATRHQLDVAATLFTQSKNVYLPNSFAFGPGGVVTLAELQHGRRINDALGNVGLYTEIYRTNWLELQNIRYKPGCTLLISTSCEFPVFMTISDILVRDGNMVWLFGECYETLGFSSHFHAYLVTRCSPAKYECIKAAPLRYPYPVSVHENVSDLAIHIGLKYRL